MPHCFPLDRLLAAAGQPPPLAAPPACDRPFRPAKAPAIAVIVDDSEDALNAAWRAALIAQARGAPLELLHGPPRYRGASRSGGAMDDLARRISHHLRISASARTFTGNLLDVQAGAMDAAGLLVTHAATGWRPLDWLTGTLAQRLSRRFSIPVLVVKQPASRRYRRVMVGVDLDPGSRELVAMARRLCPAARVEVVHVLGTAHEYPLRVADAPEIALRAQRMLALREAHRKIEHVIASAGGHGPDAAPRLVTGSAPDRLPEMARAARAGLLVLGQRQRRRLADLFANGSVAQTALAGSPTDVLLVPIGRPSASLAFAARGPERNAG